MTLKQALSILILLVSVSRSFIFGDELIRKSLDYKSHAETLLLKYGLEPKLHTILVTNCYFIMQNLIDLEKIPQLKSMQKSEIEKAFFAKNFWGDKLERELKIPYSDKEFHLFIAKLQKELNGFIKYLRIMNTKSSDFNLKIFGSMAKARFGVNSSLDIMIHSDNQEFLAKLDHGIYSSGHQKFRGNIELITSNNEASFLLGPFHPVTVGELSNLARVYQNILESKNLDVKQNKNSFSIAFTERQPQVSLEFNAIEDRVYYLINKLNKLENVIENSTELFVPSYTTDNARIKREFVSQLRELSINFSGVQADLRLIVEQKESVRHNKIKSVIEPASYRRLKGLRGKQILALVESKLIFITKQSQILN